MPEHHHSLTLNNLSIMIFIAGVSPKIKVLDQNPRRCPICGLHQAHSKRMDYYFSLFFIPLFRVKKGQPFVICDRCEKTSPEFGQDFTRPHPEDTSSCKYCGKKLDQDFKYCPQCGKKV